MLPACAGLHGPSPVRVSMTGSGSTAPAVTLTRNEPPPAVTVPSSDVQRRPSAGGGPPVAGPIVTVPACAAPGATARGRRPSTSTQLADPSGQKPCGRHWTGSTAPCRSQRPSAAPITRPRGTGTPKVTGWPASSAPARLHTSTGTVTGPPGASDSSVTATAAVSASPSSSIASMLARYPAAGGAGIPVTSSECRLNESSSCASATVRPVSARVTTTLQRVTGQVVASTATANDPSGLRRRRAVSRSMRGR